MKEQNLKDREIAIAIQELTGKLSIRDIRDHLKGKGLITLPDDYLDLGELELTRKVIQRVRKFQNIEGTGSVELVNLFDTTDSGERIPYYKHDTEMTAEEYVQICTYWHGRGRYADKQLLHYARKGKRMHGRRFQRMLPFALPAAEPAGAG